MDNKKKNPVGRPDKFDGHMFGYSKLCEDLNIVYGVYLELFKKYQWYMNYFENRVYRGKMSREEYEKLGKHFKGFYARRDKRGNY